MYEVFCDTEVEGDVAPSKIVPTDITSKKVTSSTKKSYRKTEGTEIVKKYDSSSSLREMRNQFNMSQPAFMPGKMVWVKSNDHSLAGALGVSGWKRATISSRYGDTLTLIPDFGQNKRRSGRYGQVSRYRVTGIDFCSPANQTVQPDLTALNYIHKPAILFNIKMRALWKQPYTFIGEVLISVNPLQEVPETGVDFLRDPHPKTVAERALRRLRFGIKERERRELSEIKNTKATDSVEIESKASRSRSRLNAFKTALKNVTKTIRSSSGTKKVLDKKAAEKEEAESDTLSDLKINQAIVISGESGSGKTEAARRVLSQLVDGFEADEDEDSLQDRILASEPILECFGNARTVKNPNSSRFGKFLKVYYTIDEEDFVELRAAAISTYLLEISRVIRQGTKERNFRIFYNILSTPVFKLQESLGLKAATYSFKYIGGAYIKEHKDEDQYFELKDAFQNSALGIKWTDLLEAVVGVLHLGNITFISSKSNKTDAAEIKEPSRDSEYNAVEWTTKLWGIEESPLKAAMLEKVVRVAREEVITIRSPKAAKDVTDSIAKKVYALIFQWLISKLNSSLIESDYSFNQLPFTNFVGILDVFGFEVFEINSLEQLLINYANEILQLVFTEQILIAEAELFRREGIAPDDSVIPKSSYAEEDSRIRIKFFNTLFKTLDNTMRLPKADDTRLAKELQKALKNEPLYVHTHKKDFGRKFIIKHFASKVEYTFGEFLIKNNDSLPDISHMFNLSTNPLLQQLQLGEKGLDFQNELQREKSLGNVSQGSRKRVRRKRKKSIFRASDNFSKKSSKRNTNNALWSSSKMATGKRKVTVSSVFKKQILDLSSSLKQCGCSYIRCVKPNPNMTPPSALDLIGQGENVAELYSFYGLEKAEMVLKARSFYKTGNHIKKRIDNQVKPIVPEGYFDADYVARQLHFLGVFSAVKVLKSGLPTRIAYATFVRSFQSSIPLESSPYLRNIPLNNPKRYRNYIAALLYAFRVPASSYRLGLTKVFFKFGQIDNISLILNAKETWNDVPRKGSSMVEGSLVEVDELNIQSLDVVTKRFHHTLMRMRWRIALVKISAFLVFKNMNINNKAAKVIQRAVRIYFEKKQILLKMLYDQRAKELQRVWRGYKGRQIAKKLKAEKEKHQLLVEKKREAIRKKYLEKRKAKSIEAFSKVQQRHRKQLTLEKIKLQRKQERIIAAMEEIRLQKRMEAERLRIEREKAQQLREKYKQEKELKEVRRKRQIQKQQAIHELQKKIKINVKHMKEEEKIENQKNSPAFRRATLKREKSEKLSLESGVAEINKIKQKIEQIEEVEAVISEIAEDLPKNTKSKDLNASAKKKRQWATRGSSTHKGTFLKRMEIARNAEIFYSDEESDGGESSDSGSLIVIEKATDPKKIIKKKTSLETTDKKTTKVSGLAIVRQGVFDTRYKLLQEKVRQISSAKSFNDAETDARRRGKSFMGEFAKQELKVKRTSRDTAEEKKQRELAKELQNFSKILEIELSLDEINKNVKEVSKNSNRNWKNRVRKTAVKYKNIEASFPVEKQNTIRDPRVLKKLENFLRSTTYNKNTKLFRCNDNNPRKSFSRLGENVNVVTAGAKVMMKKRKISLQKFAVSPGILKVYDVKNTKRVVVLKMKIDHKIKFTLDEDVPDQFATGEKAPAWKQGKVKSRIFVLEVPTGHCVCFEFKSTGARNNWYAELRKAQLGFFGNNILDVKARTKYQEVDRLVKENGDVAAAVSTLDDVVGKKNATTNPKFRRSNKVETLMKNFEKNSATSPVADWTTKFLNIGKKPKSTRIPTSKSAKKRVKKKI